MRKLAVLLPVAALAVAGCGSDTTTTVNPNAKEHSPPGDIPDNQVFVAYKPAGGGFTVKVPEGWAKRASGTGVVFTNHFNSVAVDAGTAKRLPTPAQARSVVVPALAKANPGFRLVSVNVLRRPAGAALHIVYEARSRPDPVTGKRTVQTVERYAFFRKGQQAVLTLSGARGADNVDPWRTVSSSLRWSR
jgi:hypothetical protein